MGGPEEDHEDSVVSSSRPVRCSRKRAPPFMAVAESPLFDTVVVLDRLPGPSEGGEAGEGEADNDQLFLLPESVLGMDSISFREDVASIAPSFIPNFGAAVTQQLPCSPHNSLDSTDSNRSLRPIEEHPHPLAVVGTPDGLRMARASNGCKTLWLCKMIRLLVETPTFLVVLKFPK